MSGCWPGRLPLCPCHSPRPGPGPQGHPGLERRAKGDLRTGPAAGLAHPARPSQNADCAPVHETGAAPGVPSREVPASACSAGETRPSRHTQTLCPPRSAPTPLSGSLRPRPPTPPRRSERTRGACRGVALTNRERIRQTARCRLPKAQPRARRWRKNAAQRGGGRVRAREPRDFRGARRTPSIPRGCGRWRAGGAGAGQLDGRTGSPCRPGRRVGGRAWAPRGPRWEGPRGATKPFGARRLLGDHGGRGQREKACRQRAGFCDRQLTQ